MILTQLLAALASALMTTSSAPPPGLAAGLTACAPDQLSWTFDGEGGLFDGMSQSGSLLVVRNVGPAPCRTASLPQLQFRDAQGRPLAAARRAPVGMHPGPVMPPVALAPGAEATAIVHWVQGDVYDGHNCVAASQVMISGPGHSVLTPLRAHICGPAGRPVPFDQAPLRTDPILTPRR